jgi:hypothetical protein
MTGRHAHHSLHHPKMKAFWLREEIVLAALAMLLAFAAIYAYTHGANLYYPIAGAISMGGVIYLSIWLAKNRRF